VGTWVLARSCGLPMSLIGAFTVMSLLAVGILFPSGPGQFGNYQAAVIFALAIQPMAQLEGPISAYVFSMYVLMQGFTVVSGVVAMMTSHVSLSRITGGGDTDPAPLREGRSP